MAPLRATGLASHYVVGIGEGSAAPPLALLFPGAKPLGRLSLTFRPKESAPNIHISRLAITAQRDF